MSKLLASEWERLWKRKVTWLMFAAIPIMVYAAAKYCLHQNNNLSPDLPQFTVAGNFPVLGLAEMLMTAFNFVVLVIAAMIVTEEYRSGQLRMVLIRAHSFQQIIIAKYIVLAGFIFLYLVAYFISCYGMGYALFSNPETYPQFHYQDHVTLGEGFIYNLKFYGLAFLTLVAMSSVVFFIAIVSHTTTTTLGIGIGFLLISFLYPNIIQLFQQFLNNEVVIKLFFTSIPMIQWEGLTLMLAKSSSLYGWMLLVLSCYILLFHLLIILVTRRKSDIFI
ncbi:ABC transporter permease [Sporosarcina limicola]|uniref:ABC-type transport system involved in multi-copper enzyme maturation permease subunit n=1 Tax=Sporosarcina limicola TaxID=34101 RepID=A0A927MJ65_9BACL|nr:ABC transporter permease [Sporosarcina limicola]MBE1555370.1 ABC-type transport system involved in multi-copper enzyme maturation permease subunit [Sporosarcina limicola]